MLQNLPCYANIPASDLSRARQFYEGVLGFNPGTEVPGGVQYTCGNGTSFNLYPSQFAGTNQATAMAWDTDDIERDVADLRARGVVFEEYDFPDFKTVNGIAQLGADRVAWFKDSEGNILAIGQH